MEQGGWVHPSPRHPSPLPGKDPKYVWLVTDQGGREVVASCQPGFPDPKLPSRRLFSESLGWGSGLSCLYHSYSVALGLCCQVLLKPGHQGQSAVHTQFTRSGRQRRGGQKHGFYLASCALLYCWGQRGPLGGMGTSIVY